MTRTAHVEHDEVIPQDQDSESIDLESPASDEDGAAGAGAQSNAPAAHRDGVGAGADEDDEPAAPRLVPVNEAIRYRRRAQAAEEQARELESRANAMEAELAASRAELARAQEARRIDESLLEANVVDLETARALVQARSQSAPETSTDLAALIDELRRGKPFLFRASSHSSLRSSLGVASAPRVRPSAMGAATPPTRSAEPGPVERAATAAHRSGRTDDVMRYLRMRRSAAGADHG